MIWRHLLVWITAIALCLGAPVAEAADWDPPLSFSNAELKGRDFSGQVLRTAELSNANLEFANFEQADVRGAIFSGSVLTNANFHQADLTNAMADYADFTGADLSDAILVETILLQTVFDEAVITGADFSDAILDGVQVSRLCQTASGINSQTGVATRDSLGCR